MARLFPRGIYLFRVDKARFAPWCDWHVECKQTTVTIALPIHHGRLSPLLDTARRLLVLTCHDGRETSRREVSLSAQSAEALACSLAELHLDLLLCGAVSEALSQILHQHNIRVWPYLCGEIEAILHACCHGQLAREEFRMPGCHNHHGGAGEGKPPRCRGGRARMGKQIIATPNPVPES